VKTKKKATTAEIISTPFFFADLLVSPELLKPRPTAASTKKIQQSFSFARFSPRRASRRPFSSRPLLCLFILKQTEFQGGSRRGGTYYYHPIFLGNVHWNVDLAKEKRSKNFPKHRIKALIAL